MLTHLKIRFMKNSLLILVLGWIFFSCTEQRKESANKVVNIHLEPRIEKVNKLSEVIDSVFIIPLETCEEALLATISKLECDDNLYFVQNSRDNLVYVFDSNGKFVRQIAKKGNTVFYNKKNTHIKEGHLINDLLDGHIWRLGVR